MSIQKFLFVAIDKLFDGAQNNRKSTRFKDVDFIVDKDIVYDKSAPTACTLDTYCVKRDGKYPVLFYIHGGGFVAGDKKYRRALSRWSAQQGYFVVNVNYGLCPDYKCPTILRQLVSALNWVGANAEKYSLDLDRMIVSGDSAGGYYSAILACICTNKSLQDKLGVSTDLKFAGAILNCGIYDVGVALQQKYPFNLGDKLLNDFAGISKKDIDGYDFLEFCKPVKYVGKDFPKSFVTYADKDFFCGGQGPKLVETLKANGVYVEEFHSTKFMENHCFSLTWNGKSAKINNDKTAAFMKKFAAREI